MLCLAKSHLLLLPVPHWHHTYKFQVTSFKLVAFQIMHAFDNLRSLIDALKSEHKVSNLLICSISVGFLAQENRKKFYTLPLTTHFTARIYFTLEVCI